MTIKLKKFIHVDLKFSLIPLLHSKMYTILSGMLYCTVGINTRRRLFTFGQIGKGLKQDEEAHAVDVTFVKTIWLYRAGFAFGARPTESFMEEKAGS